MRVDKFLSECRMATRSEAAKAIRRGEVTVDGIAVKRADAPVDPENSVVTYGGVTVCYRKNTYVLLNKPEGYVSATEDPREQTVLTLLSAELQKFDLFPCGRLDKNTTGVMLLTDNGPLAHFLLSPKHHVEKEYRYTCEHPLTHADVQALERGVDIGGYVTAPCKVSPEGETVGRITLSEGKYHQIKLMFHAVGNRIIALERTRFAFLTAEGLARGEYRLLTDEEIQKLEQYGR